MMQLPKPRQDRERMLRIRADPELRILSLAQLAKKYDCSVSVIRHARDFEQRTCPQCRHHVPHDHGDPVAFAEAMRQQALRKLTASGETP